MGDTIRIKISDVERVRGSIIQAEKAIKQALQGVDSALKAADWQDSNRRNFEEKWKTARAAADFDRSAQDLDRQLSRVIEKAKTLGGS